MKHKNGFIPRKRIFLGFTLIEILVVISIIGFIATAAVVYLKQAREAGRIAALLQFSNGVKTSLADNLVSYWSFDNGDATDSWGQNHGTVNGATSGEGVLGKAMYFDGINDYIDLGNSVQIESSGTIAMWVKITSWPPAGKDSTLIGKYNYSWHLGISDLKKLVFKKWNIYQRMDSNSALVLDKWYHFVFTISDGASNNAKLYIDGKLEKSQNITVPLNKNGSLMLSKYVQSDIYWHTGMIDEVQIFSDALTLAQIQKLYAEGAKKFGIALK